RRARAPSHRRDRRDRAGVRMARHGAACARGGAGPRLPARDRAHGGGRRDRRAGPPSRRSRVHADRSAAAYRMSRLGIGPLIVLAAVALLAVAGPLLWTIPPEATDPLHGLAGPSAAHPLGTDELGRDMLSRLL